MTVQHEIAAVAQLLEQPTTERELARERQRDELGELLGERLDRRRQHVVMEEDDTQRVGRSGG